MQMTRSREELDSELGFSDEPEIKSSAAPLQKSPSPADALTSWWCVFGMREIYTEGVHSYEQGKPAYSIYETP